MELLFIALYGLLVYWYSARTDKPKSRLVGLSIDGQPLADWTIVDARAFANRRIGLLNHARMAERSGLLLGRSRTVHTVGMLFAIDLVFLNAAGTVVGTRASVAPGRSRVRGPRGTRMVLELPSGAIEATPELRGGRQLQFATG